MSQKQTYNFELNFLCEQQLGINLCWAAIATSISNFYNPEEKKGQLEFVESILGAKSDQVWYANKALEKSNHLRKIIYSPLSLPAIKDELHAGNPVVAKIEFGFGPNHLVCITGYNVEDIKIEDPKYPSGYANYELFKNNYRKFGMWTTSYLTKA